MSLWFKPSLAPFNPSRALHISQAKVLKIRTNKHKSCIRTGTHVCSRALQYRIACGRNRISTFVLLGEFTQPYGSSPQPLGPALLDLGEMYLCLQFQTLPPKTLRHYLPASVPTRRTQIGLNVASPLNQNPRDGQERSKRELAKLKESTDPEVRQYLSDITKEARAAALAALEEQRFVPVSQGLRKVSKKQHSSAGDSRQATTHLNCR
ncbi:hypothetical protein Slin15195_G041880 [Septoria linicola]|uniref:Uncharacterized protein n=1 Tax=Septoria linicola TaxID=215465 RepID=A0A9Q9AK90_9PEZI|nr:hypothetical protein Slin14017_G045390 [Septoria linicola]USW50869.1 hypothetical protein Slin15195_G041880 [Septoria linicola]